MLRGINPSTYVFPSIKFGRATRLLAAHSPTFRFTINNFTAYVLTYRQYTSFAIRDIALHVSGLFRVARILSRLVPFQNHSWILAQ
jgi:hypothetical protein